MGLGDLFGFENRYLAGDGSYRWLLWSAACHEEEELVYAVAKDITDQKERAAAGLRASEQLKVAQRIARMGTWEYCLADRSLTVSEGFREIFELDDTSSPVDFDRYMERVHPDDRTRVRVGMERGVHGQDCPEMEYRIVRRDGSERTIFAQSELVHESGVLVAMRGATQDITDRREAEQELHRSQQLFEQGFENAPVGMGLVDPERRAFTRVNDAMCAIKGQTRDQLQATGWIDRATHPDELAADREVYAQLVSGALKFDQREKRYRRADGSGGWISRHLSPLRDPSGAVTGLFSQVIDITEQKEHEQKLKNELEDASWVARIRAALDEDRFVLHAQPIIDLATGETVQRELLIRMVDEAGELVPPGNFLPTAEKYGLITQIDSWVVDQGAKLAAEGASVAINLSGASIGDPHLLQAIQHSIRITGADPGDLMFEITETALMENLDRGELFARKLVDIGCQFALDDFGTGFGSFTYLKQLPAGHLKIDMEFVRDLCRAESDRHVVKAVVALAAGFGQKTIAEGVEDEETLQLLRKLGVTHAQGYHLGRPAPLARPQGSPLG